MNYRTLQRRTRLRRTLTALFLLAAMAGLAVTGVQAIAGMTGRGPSVTRPEGRPSVSPTQPPSPPAEEPALPNKTLRPGDRGPAVLILQRTLHALGYTIPTHDGSYGPVTQHAVMAFQKVHGLTADGIAGASTRRALAEPIELRPRAGGSGLRVEVDLARQVLLVIQDGVVTDVYDVSTGNGETYWQDGREQVALTPPGSFETTWKVDGWRDGPLGMMYRPVYFNGGIAIHGSPDVPAHPASHGCVRVTNWVIDQLFDRLVTPGTPVLVY